MSGGGQTEGGAVQVKEGVKNARIECRADCLIADCTNADAGEMAQACRDLAAQCLSRELNRVLVHANGCHPEAHHLLRNAFTTMLLAGIPAGFRLALVTDVPRVWALFADLQRDLALVKVHAKAFNHESDAVEWLRAASRPVQDARAASSA